MKAAIEKRRSKVSPDDAEKKEIRVAKCDPKSPIFLSRMAVISTLLVAMSLFGYFSYTLLTTHEDETFRTLFDSLGEDVFIEINNALSSIQNSASLYAEYVGIQSPESHDWPNASVPHYGIMNDHVEIVGGVRFAMLPIVQPWEIAGFEAHSKTVFANTPLVPESAGFQDFGYGIFSYGEDGEKYHDTTGATDHSPYNYLTPVFYSAFPASTMSYLYNLHSSDIRARVMDATYECVNEGGTTCICVSDIIQTISEVEYRPNTLFYYPIRPLNNQSDIVGFLTAGFKWDEILESSLSETVENIEVTVISPERMYSFELAGGKSCLLGEGDLHNEKFNYLERSMNVVLEGAASKSVPYVIKIYPTQQFYDKYHSDIPITWTVVGLSFILAITILFVLYDALVKADIDAKELILQHKRRFVRLVSHEIRTPLNSVKMGLHLQVESLKKGCTAGPVCSLCDEMRELTADIISSTDIALDVLNDLLHYDKIEMGKMDLEVKPIEVWQLIKGVMHSFKLDAMKRDITLVLNCDIDNSYNDSEKLKALANIVLLGDSIRVSQVLRNLLSNALKFSPPFSVVTVRAKWVEHGLPSARLLRLKNSQADLSMVRMGSILFSVSDTGPGISHSNQKKLFGEGQQFNANELQGGQGSGLGLYISKGIVVLHGGKIWVDSKDSGEEKGSTFYVEFPVGLRTVEMKADPLNSRDTVEAVDVCCATSKDRSRLNTEANSVAEDITGQRKILVVDDSLLNRKLMCKLLGRRGYSFGEAGNGQECLDKIKSPEGSDYDCILMDNHMPIMNGTDAVKLLRSDHFTLPIFGLTGSVMAEDINLFETSGVDYVFQKPLDINLFDEKLKQFFAADSKSSKSSSISKAEELT